MMTIHVQNSLNLKAIEFVVSLYLALYSCGAKIMEYFLFSLFRLCTVWQVVIQWKDVR